MSAILGGVVLVVFFGLAIILGRWLWVFSDFMYGEIKQQNAMAYGDAGARSFREKHGHLLVWVPFALHCLVVLAVGWGVVVRACRRPPRIRS